MIYVTADLSNKPTVKIAFQKENYDFPTLSLTVSSKVECLETGSQNNTTIFLSALHLLYETQSPDRIQQSRCLRLNHDTPASWTKKYGLLDIPLSYLPLDLFVTGYCIPHSNRSWLLSTSTMKILKHFPNGLDMSSNHYCSIGHIMEMKVHSDDFINLPFLYPHTQKVTELTIFQLAEDCAKLPFFFPQLEDTHIE